MTIDNTETALRIIDADTHYTEPHDLWTSRAPAKWRDRVPHVVEVEGVDSWVVDGIVLSRAMPSSVIRPDGSKDRSAEFRWWSFDDTHHAAWDLQERIQYMDDQGVWAQIAYPNVAGLGSQRFGLVKDAELRNLCTTIYNDAMAEMQEESKGRFLPMALIPWWSVEDTVAEVERAKDLGFRGINACSEPHNRGVPDLGEPVWDALWEICSELDLPVNFHIGAGDSAMAWYGSTPWPSHDDGCKVAIGSTMTFLSNAGVITNLIFSGVLERFPSLKVVSVESGVGWIPFLLEALDYQIGEAADSTRQLLSMKPSDYFRRQVYACFWFEESGVRNAIDAVGPDHILFETDFPHPTCLYPDGVTHALASLADLDPSVQRKLFQDNAAELYKIDLRD
jgi:predicted TIM-barrel fold metal-dependent hydrolase